MRESCCIFLILSVLCGSYRCKTISDFEDQLLDFISPLPDDEKSKEIAREVHMGAMEMIAHYGYKAENHTAKTEDGFLLGLHRIPKSKKGSAPHQPYPVFMQHGVLCCSGNFIDNGEDSLADKGYDVWLGNLRGNRYSKQHLTLSEHDDKFWDFSWDEHAIYDLPAMIDYIREVTKKDKVLLVAHSLGTTTAFAMLADLPEYNKKVKGYFALGPVGSINYITSSASFPAKYNHIVHSFVDFLKRNKAFAPHSNLIEKFLTHFCSGTKAICNLFVGFYSGYDSHITNQTRFPIYTNDCSSGTGIKVLYHLAQLYEGNRMSHFDYGPEKNMDVYGQESAPIYDLSKITTPIVLAHAANDALADPIDVAILQSRLNTVVETYLFPDPTATHSAFFWTTNGTERFFNKFLELLKTLQNK